MTDQQIAELQTSRHRWRLAALTTWVLLASRRSRTDGCADRLHDKDSAEEPEPSRKDPSFPESLLRG